MKVKDAVVIVTGAGSGMGRAMTSFMTLLPVIFATSMALYICLVDIQEMRIPFAPSWFLGS